VLFRALPPTEQAALAMASLDDPDKAVQLAALKAAQELSPGSRAECVEHVKRLQSDQATTTLREKVTGAVKVNEMHVGKGDQWHFSPDGRRVANAGSIYDVATGTVMVTLPAADLQMAFHPDGQQFAVRQEDGGVSLHDATTGVLLRIIAVNASNFCITPNGQYIVSHNNSCVVSLHAWESGALVSEPRLIYAFELKQLAVSPDSRLIATGGTDQRLTLRDMATGALVRQWHRGSCVLARRGERGGEIVFSPDGKFVASPTFAAIVIYVVATGEKHLSIAAVSKLAFSSDGLLLAHWNSRSKLQLREAATGALLHEDHLSKPGTIAFSPDGRLMLTIKKHSGHPQLSEVISHDAQVQLRLHQIVTGKRASS